MKIQVLRIWCKCTIVVLKRGCISEMSLSIALSKEKEKSLLHCAGTPWVTLLADAFD